MVQSVRPRAAGLALAAVLLSISLMGFGCQAKSSVGAHALIQHQAMIDFSGLAPMAEVPPLRVEAAIPENWEALPVHATALYTHQQWRAPSRATGVGVAYVRMPLPLSAKAVLWFAKNEYGKRKAVDGKQLAEWVDPAGRTWFEAENAKYHVRGYVITRGFEAWIVYLGYRVPSIPNAAELNLAARSADKVLPTPLISRGAKEGEAASR